MSVSNTQTKMVIFPSVGKHSLLPQEVLSAHMTPVEPSAHTGVVQPLSDLAPRSVKCHSWLGSCFFWVVYELGSAQRPTVQALNYTCT